MKFSEILEELKKGEKVTREKWEKNKTENYKYIKFENGEYVAFKDAEGNEATYVGSIFYFDDFIAEDWKIYEGKTTRIWQPESNKKYYFDVDEEI